MCLQCWRPGFNPWVEKTPWRRAWQPTPVFLPGESPWMEQPGGLQSMQLQRVRHDWVINTFTFSVDQNSNPCPLSTYPSKSRSNISFSLLNISHTNKFLHDGITKTVLQNSLNSAFLLYVSFAYLTIVLTPLMMYKPFASVLSSVASVVSITLTPRTL